jgi:hypothetical protein
LRAGATDPERLLDPVVLSAARPLPGHLSQRGGVCRDFAAVYGAGLRVFLTRNHVVCGDLRLHQIPDALGKTLDGIGVPRGDTLWLLELSGGLSWFPGGG